MSSEEVEQAARHYAPITTPSAVFSNYASYDEFKAQADEELAREVAAGYVDMFASKAAMELA